jgi:hypothetical protein
MFSSGEVHRLTTPEFNTNGLPGSGRETRESLYIQKGYKDLIILFNAFRCQLGF